MSERILSALKITVNTTSSMGGRDRNEFVTIEISYLKVSIMSAHEYTTVLHCTLLYCMCIWNCTYGMCSAFLFLMAVLHGRPAIPQSYVNMGMASVACSSGCSCDPSRFDGHHADKTSQVGVLILLCRSVIYSSHIYAKKSS